MQRWRRRSFSYDFIWGRHQLMGAKLEDVKNGASVRRITSARPVHVVSVDWIGDQAISVVFRDHTGAVAETVLYRDDEHRLEVEQRPALVIRCRWRTAALSDGSQSHQTSALLRPLSGHPHEPGRSAPHQISAVYGEHALVSEHEVCHAHWLPVADRPHGVLLDLAFTVTTYVQSVRIAAERDRVPSSARPPSTNARGPRRCRRFWSICSSSPIPR